MINLCDFNSTDRNHLQEKSGHTNKHQGMKCEKSLRTAEGWKKSRGNTKKGNIHSRMCAAMQFSSVQLVASQFCWPALHAPSPHHSPACLDAQQPPPTPPTAPTPLLLQQPHYNCVSSEWPATSYLSSGMGSFMSAGHRFNTRPVGGMTGGLVDWWTAWLSVEAVLLSDWTPFWRCWGHRRQENQNVLLGNIPGHKKLFWWATWLVQLNIF